LIGVEGFSRQKYSWLSTDRPKGRPVTSLRDWKSLRTWKVSESSAMSSPASLPGARLTTLDGEGPFRQLGGIDARFRIHRPLLNQRTLFS
jgi:hypothetical protein